MMDEHREAKLSALDRQEPRFRERGYTLVREPSPSQLPGFLSQTHPDAIAVGAVPSLVVEVLHLQGDDAEARLDRLRKLLQGRGDWRLEIVYAPRSSPPLHPVAPRAIAQALLQSGRLAGDEPRASLLLAWSALEAAARNLETRLAAEGLPPRTLVDLLVSNGHVPQSDATALLRLGDLRNAIAHGQIDTAPAAADLHFLIGQAERLIAVPAV